MAGIRELDFETFFEMFGRGRLSDWDGIYKSTLRDALPQAAREYWDKHGKFFYGKGKRPSFYFRGTSGFFAWSINSYINRIARIRPQIERLLESQTLEEQQKVRGCLCYGYPFHSPGKPDKLRTEHLLKDGKPVLILQGERDPFGNRAESESYPLHQRVRRVYVPDGEHSFKPRKASGVSLAQNMDFAAQQSVEFIKEQL